MQDTHVLDTLKVATYPKSFNNVIFLDEVVSDSSYYRSAILTLKSAAPDDTVEIIFNTEGGASFTASVFVAAMRQCQARITGNLSGLCASAGTTIALNCDDWIIGDDLAFMIHSNAYGGGGSAEKVRDHMKFMDKWNSDTLRRDYEGFLTEEELLAMIDSGKEYWFDAPETSKRLQAYQEFHQNKHNKAIEDSYTQQFAEEDAMVEEALASLQIPVAEREIFDKISSQLEDYFSQEQIGGQGTPTVSEETASRLQDVVETLTGAEGEQVIELTKGDNYFLLYYRYDEEDEVIELELQTDDSELIVISKYALEDYDRDYLLELAKGVGAKWSHNSGKPRLIDNIVSHLEGLVG